MAVYRRSRRQRFLLALLVLVSITAITLDFQDSGTGVMGSLRSGARDVFAPVESAVDGVASPIGDFFGGFTRYRKVKAENARLRAEVDKARGDAARGEYAEHERRLLLALQSLDFSGDIQGVTARLVAESPSNFQLTVSIDRGRDHRVDVGMPVVTDGGLVGRVVEASRARSTVLLIDDPSSAVGVRLADSGDVGVVAGAGSRGPLSVDLVSFETPVAAGEIVVTSGLQGGIFPPGIPVGSVREARVRPGRLEQEVLVDPLVDLRRLEFVRVLLWTPE